MNELRYPSPNKLGAIKLRKWICEVKLKEPIWTRINQKKTLKMLIHIKSQHLTCFATLWAVSPLIQTCIYLKYWKINT